jgi:murein L,D-transpeptidase YafK
MNYDAIIDFLMQHLFQILLAALTSIVGALRIIKPRLIFHAFISLLETIFRVQISEIFFVSEHAILKRIAEDTAANRVALIEFKRNGTTEINVLTEYKLNLKRYLKELDTFEGHQFRDMIDDLTVLNGSKVFDKKTERHKDFYELISKSYECTSFVMIPVYQNDRNHHVVVVLAAFDGHKIFDSGLFSLIKIQAAKVAKIAYLIR